jgi:hypothetical protein
VATKIITAHNNLDILSTPGPPLALRSGKIPSWVPDWTYKEKERTILFGITAVDEKFNPTYIAAVLHRTHVGRMAARHYQWKGLRLIQFPV